LGSYTDLLFNAAAPEAVVVMTSPRAAAASHDLRRQDTHSADCDLFSGLFARRVPEVACGDVQVIAAVRDRGHYAKVAVWSVISSINAASVCIGKQGVRVHDVEAWFPGERISVVNYDSDPLRYVANAIDVAVTSVRIISERSRDACVVVPVAGFAAAIGRDARNVRLASSLTGWRIAICTSRCGVRRHVHPHFDASAGRSVWDSNRSCDDMATRRSLR
jgi:N utilization substance protein A